MIFEIVVSADESSRPIPERVDQIVLQEHSVEELPFLFRKCPRCSELSIQHVRIFP